MSEKAAGADCDRAGRCDANHRLPSEEYLHLAASIRGNVHPIPLAQHPEMVQLVAGDDPGQ